MPAVLRYARKALRFRDSFHISGNYNDESKKEINKVAPFYGMQERRYVFATRSISVVIIMMKARKQERKKEMDTAKPPPMIL